VTTYEERDTGEVLSTLGDRFSQHCSRGTETAPPAPSANASTQASDNEKEPETNIVQAPEMASTDEAAGTKEVPVPEPVKAQLPDAYYVRDYVPDGTKVLPGKPVFQTWTMYNPNGQVWPVGCALRWVGGDSMLDIDTDVPGSVSIFENAASSNSTLSEVFRGGEYSFSVRLRAPEKLGRAVSYWRLYTPEGAPFGHRLWCEVNVVSTLAPAEQTKSEQKKPEAAGMTSQEQTKDISESQMVFPKLDKESPASSVHMVAPSTDKSGVVAKYADLTSSIDDDLLSVTVDDEESSDDGFFTDEDYDMVEDVRQ